MKPMKKLLALLLALVLCLGLAPLLPRAEAAGVTINSTNFPDANFRSYVSSNFDTNHDSYLNDSEINSIWRIDVHQMGVTDMTVSRWKTNKIQPSMSQFVEIARILQVDIKDLLEIDVPGNLY